MTQTPQEHSTLIGGSTADRRINCHESYWIEQLAPPQRGNDYAREGTALHEMMALILGHGKEPEDLLPFTHNQPAKGAEPAWSMTIDKAKWDELGAPALASFDAFLEHIETTEDADAVFFIEKKLAFPGVEAAFGTSDVVFRCGRIAGIWDWKFGRNPVKAEGNSQLLFYCAAARAGLPKMFGGAEFLHLAICQPMAGEADVWVTDHAEVDEFVKTVADAVTQIKGRSGLIQRGPWCKYATCKALCPLYTRSVAQLGEVLNNLEAYKKGDRGVEEVSGAGGLGPYLAMAMDLAEYAKDWSAAVAGSLQDHLELGHEVDGWKLVDKRSSGREWVVPDDIVKRRLASRGLKAEDYLNVSVVTPPAAEKALEKLGKKLPEELYRAKPSSGKTLTRAGDPRPEAENPVKQAKELGVLLASILQSGERK